MNAPNLHQICTWQPASACKGCGLPHDLNCRFRFRGLVSFLGIFAVYMVPAYFGMIRSGYGSWLWGWGGMAIFFFGFWEIYILCRHCPYYAKSGLFLQCMANYGCPKFFTYEPGPIRQWEKVQLLIGFAVMGGYPFVFMILGGAYLWLFLSMAGLLFFFGALIRVKCTKCINFSCILNRVPEQTVNQYLNRNPVMAAAWKKAGWQVKEGPADIDKHRGI